MPKTEPRHCDRYVEDYNQPKCLRWWVFINRLPATINLLAEECGVRPKLFADYEGKRVQLVMASRFGDVGITTDLKAENGYEKRVHLSELTNFSDAP